MLPLSLTYRMLVFVFINLSEELIHNWHVEIHYHYYLFYSVTSMTSLTISLSIPPLKLSDLTIITTEVNSTTCHLAFNLAI